MGAHKSQPVANCSVFYNSCMLTAAYIFEKWGLEGNGIVANNGGRDRVQFKNERLENSNESYNCQAGCRMGERELGIDQALLILFCVSRTETTAYKDMERQLCLMESNDYTVLLGHSALGRLGLVALKSSLSNCQAYGEQKTTRQ